VEVNDKERKILNKMLHNRWEWGIWISGANESSGRIIRSNDSHTQRRLPAGSVHATRVRQSTVLYVCLQRSCAAAARGEGVYKADSFIHITLAGSSVQPKRDERRSGGLQLNRHFYEWLPLPVRYLILPHRSPFNHGACGTSYRTSDDDSPMAD